MARRFFFTCAGFLCLALAYHLGASRATAQPPTPDPIRFVESVGEQLWVITEAGDIYALDPLKLPVVAKGAGWSKYRIEAVK